MKYLIIGSGGREHAIAWKLQNEDPANEVYVAPGNGGIDPERRVDIDPFDFPALSSWCIEKRVDLVIVGPEAPLAAGIVDYLTERKIPAFGPTKAAARLESSKLFAKRIMNAAGVPTAHFREFKDRRDLAEYIQTVETFPIVIKRDDLAAGKGVCVAASRDEALAFVDEQVPAGSPAFLEEYIEGEEASVLCVTDGTNFVTFAAAQDHKRAYDGDRGPNTGGMGAYAPAPVMTPQRLTFVRERILAPVINRMREEGTPFRGVLYAGLIVSGDDIFVLEFNVRFGDPEAQVIIPLLDVPLGTLLHDCMSGTLRTAEAAAGRRHALTVVIASAGYPGTYEKGKIISGLERVHDEVIVFHAGTVFKDGKYYTNGGRVLNVTGFGSTLREARDRAYRAVEAISFEGAFYRKDIGYRALA